MIVTSGITIQFGAKPLFEGVTVKFGDGNRYGLIGANGCGKSTFMKILGGDLEQSAGSVAIDRNERLGKLRQDQFGYEDKRVLDVVLMGTYARLGWFRRPGFQQRQLARESLARVGLADLATRQIGKLSGGQQQRVFLARALAQEADIYFLDEPMAGVDARSQEQIFRVLSELRAAGKLVVVVHHDLRTASEWFDSIAMVDMRLVAAGPTATVLTPENLRRTYAGHLDVLDEIGRAVEQGGRTP